MSSPTIAGTIHLVSQTGAVSQTLYTPTTDVDVLVNLSLFNTNSSGGVAVSVRWTPPGQSQITVLVSQVNMVVGQSPGSVIFIRAAANTSIDVITTILSATTYNLDAVALKC